jgi:hypothetical protein
MTDAAGNGSALRTLAESLSTLRVQKEKAEAELKELGKLVDARTTELLDAMDVAGLTSIRVDGVGLFSPMRSTYWSIEDRVAFFAWLKAEKPGDYDALVKPDIHPQTLRGWCNEVVKSGSAPPPHTTSFTKSGVRITKEK